MNFLHIFSGTFLSYFICFYIADGCCSMDLNIISFLVYISIFAIGGTIGNSLIIAVYFSNRRSFFNRHYIVALSIVDLVVDVLVAPYTAVFELRLVTSDFICHGAEVLRHAIIGFSNLILILIASERLLMVWKPTHIVSERKKIIAILIILVISILFGLPAGAIYQVSVNTAILKVNGTDLGGNASVTTEPHCQYTTRILGDEMSQIYRNFIAFVILLEFVILIAVYVVVYTLVCRQKMRLRRSQSALKSHRRPKRSEVSQTTSSVQSHLSDCNSTDDNDSNLQSKTKKLKIKTGGKWWNLNRKNGVSVKMSESGTESEVVAVTLTSFAKNNTHTDKRMRALSLDTDTTLADTDQEGTDSKGNQTRTKKKRVKRKIRFSKHANSVRTKTWTMLFICTFIYIICWIPFFLEIFNLTSILVLRYFFFLGHATNPIVYSIVNVKVRNAIKKLLRIRCRETY
ncbi:5-hydroxytryptamine receptor-like [Ostrea edulis]|uniref:5-hydroxytryptamine receptor-like n=1 Tax=Ostrea edulis TaxID=37623 RepID=UPI0024AF8FBF|nr:5-hydroxytryptamine receptor-like [Ostrea edulis]